LPDRSVLYLSFDGALQPLGYSQVCRLVSGLSRRGLSYRLVTLERPSDIADSSRVDRLSTELKNSGVHWSYEPYDVSGGPAAASRNLGRLARAAFSAARQAEACLTHARGYQAAAIAYLIKQSLRVPYLFDARGRWIDEQLLGGRWFSNRATKHLARSGERSLYAQAAGIVTLTQLHLDDVRQGVFGHFRQVPTAVITTCADFLDFPLERRFLDVRPPTVPPAIYARLHERLVIAMVGSTNASYRHAESFELARLILEKRADAHLLVLTAQDAEFRAMASRHGIPPDRLSLAFVEHRDMPHWLSQVDWAIQFLHGGVAKRGSMPTKLAEFLAAGVRPIHFGCNDEVCSWVERTGTGRNLSSLDSSALREVADFVTTHEPSRAQLEAGRARAQQHFDLATGLERYEGLLATLLESPR
jgi:Glycosyl transferase 4-like domain